MNPSDLTADLPAPRDDEPESLRADIADELADHLSCALRREQMSAGEHTTNTEPRGLSPWPDVDGGAEPRRSQEYQRVLARFGDPAAVARKLWWDAMREKIMGQRLMTAMTALALLVCCAMAGLMWQIHSAQRDMLRESQAVNAALLDRLESQPEIAARNYDWCNCRIKLVQDRRDGLPMTAAKVVLLKLAGGQTDNSRSYPARPQAPDAEGQVDFSPVPYGYYYVVVRTDAGDLFKEEIVIHPGKDYEQTIACPVSVPTGKVVPAAISTAVTVPDDLRDRVWVLYRVSQWSLFVWSSQAGSAFDSESGGTLLDGDRWQLGLVQTVLISPTGEMYPIEWPGTGATTSTGGFAVPIDELQASVSVTALPEPMKEVTLPVGAYMTEWEVVLQAETPEPGQAATWTLLDDESRSRIKVADLTEPTFPPSPPTNATADATVEWPLRPLGDGATDRHVSQVFRVGPLSDFVPNPASFQQPWSFGGGGFGGGGFF